VSLGNVDEDQQKEIAKGEIDQILKVIRLILIAEEVATEMFHWTQDEPQHIASIYWFLAWLNRTS
jgi:hypothetical protein